MSSEPIVKGGKKKDVMGDEASFSKLKGLIAPNVYRSLKGKHKKVLAGGNGWGKPKRKKTIFGSLEERDLGGRL